MLIYVRESQFELLIRIKVYKFHLMNKLLLIFIGGGLGSVMRYLTSFYTSKWWQIGVFPLGTFLVNFLGCFLIGAFSGAIIKADSPLKFLLLTGFCGGYTTFSTFSNENWLLYQNQHYGILAVYTILSILLGFLAVFLGYEVAKNMV